MKPVALLATLLALLLIPCTGGRAQVVMDNFEDGDLLNPDWYGDTADFVVTDGRLRLMADGAGTSTLAVAVGDRLGTVPDSFSLEFLVEMDFAPSASNLTRISLVDDPDLGRSTSGIYMTFGGISGDQDTWSGFGVSGGDVVAGEFEGPPGALGAAPAVVRFRATFSPASGWELFADYSGGRDYVSQGTLADYLFFNPNTLIIECQYTATRVDKFSFDDLNAFAFRAPDTIPPGILSSAVLDDRRVAIRFDEIVRPTAADNFVLSLANNAVTGVDNLGNGVFALTLANPIPIAEPFTVTVTSVTDTVGNVATGLVANFVYEPVVAASRSNLIVTEFMADPNPVVGLPDAEYIELLNLGDTTLSLDNLSVGSGGAPVALGNDLRLPPRGYLILAGPAFFAQNPDLEPNGRIIDLPGLTNSGDNISLLLGPDTIFSINYTDAWYNDADRDDGGYSIEYTGFLGADAGCSGLWRASLDPSGGTPGRENSVLGNPADTTGPVITETDIGPDGVTLGFSEAPSPGGLDFVLTAGGREIPLVAVRDLDDGTGFSLRFAEDLSAGTVYSLTVSGVEDCAGNQTTDLELQLGIPQAPAAGDVVINEVLFNPGTGGADFVELYNCSEKVFQIAGWVLGNNQSTSSSATQVIDAARLFLPGDFLVLTPEPEDIRARYRDVDSRLLVGETLPPLSDDGGNISVSAGGVTLDAFDYDESLHSELLDDQNGVSLERLRYKLATNGGNNWFSAASAEGNATPTRANSQRRDVETPLAGNSFSLTTTTFSPDADGHEDFLEINYANSTVGSLARVRIFDAQGRPIRTLRDIELLGNEGSFRWDGENDEGRKARAGAYVILIELINPDGPVRDEKLVAVLAGPR